MRAQCNVYVTVRNIPGDAIENSATIQLLEVLDPNRFLNPIRQGITNNYDTITYYDRLVNMLSDLFDVTEENVYVFSVQVSKKQRMRSSPAIDVHFAIKKKSSVLSSFLPRWILINVLERSNGKLENIGKSPCHF